MVNLRSSKDVQRNKTPNNNHQRKTTSICICGKHQVVNRNRSCHQVIHPIYGLHLLRQHSKPSAQNSTRTPRFLSTHSFNSIPRWSKELVRHLLIAGIIRVLSIDGIVNRIKVGEVIDIYHGTVARAQARCVLLDTSVQVHDTLGSGLGPTLGVQGQQVGEDDANLGVCGSHLPNQDTVGLKDVASGFLADEDVVGTEQHKNDIWTVGGKPDSQIAILCIVGGKRPWMPFVLLVCRPAAASSL